MQPVFRIVADGKDITALINDRLLLMRTTDKAGMESDDFELKIDDRDSALALPARGAELEVYLGYAGQELTRLGRYIIDEIDLNGPPAVMELRGKACDMRGTGKSIRSGSWENVPLQRIVRDIAARNGWQPQCPVTTVVPRVDQFNESDINFITRLARQYDCTAKIGDGGLLVLPRQGGVSGTGKALGVVTVMPRDVRRWKFHLKDRGSHGTVQTRHQDSKTGEQKVVEQKNDDKSVDNNAVFVDRHVYPNKSAAEQAAKARLAEFNRSTATVNLEMSGRTDVFAERMIRVEGFKDGLDGEYLIDTVTQLFTATGWDTSVQCNGGKQGKAKAKSQKSSQTKSLKVEQREGQK
ncbi:MULTISPECIES: phage late control D family protein [unclassified Pseudomonas]|uniref:phage late control D family protein n=1 Tax=unclassified Pseudomonas TaxID=196821 RepID=UPI0021C5873D|nr:MULTISPECIES: contractile injection system protein, VgrG/Pvc8 family [unclassified Pseudomonas]MCU1730616.1 contractile injection system protein, VgrG/Pvc8 family [Pseudomonas sp. 20P_3.2_Bac4]MCU1745451.1 contractile injection system protein, VgrG/Pvc8 family [Pseudomonas sp. 20P_3.2_Bac5]